MLLKVFVRDLVLPCRIGVLPEEQDIAQPVRFLVEATLDAGNVPTRLEETLCYNALVQHLRHLTENHIPLVEDYAHRIATFCLAHANVVSARVRVEKLAILPEGGSVGAEVIAQR
jgi:7,8-dihydroneopterin aldolase/epimerase/oxygenase